MGERFSDRVDNLPDERKKPFREFSLTRYLEEDRWSWRSDDPLLGGHDSPDEEVSVDVGTWYWDKQSRKAVVPLQFNERTVRMLSIWHTDEIIGARSHEQLVPIEELGPAHKGNVFEEELPLNSFRILDESELQTYLADNQETSND